MIASKTHAGILVSIAAAKRSDQRRLIPFSAVDKSQHEVPPRFDVSTNHASRSDRAGVGISAAAYISVLLRAMLAGNFQRVSGAMGSGHSRLIANVSE